MEITEHYNNLSERQIIIEKWENQQYRMLHDDFDPDWKWGDELRGTMTFTDEPETVVPAPTDWQAEWSEATTTAKKLDVLAKMLGLEKS